MEGINFNQIGISFKGCGSYVPDQILTNQKISQKVDTSDEWIQSRTGISERRISSVEDNVTEMGYMFSGVPLSSENQCAIQTSFSTNPFCLLGFNTSSGMLRGINSKSLNPLF